jgi:hypothetical protein
VRSDSLLVQDPLRYFLIQPSDEDHRPLQVLRHPGLLGATAAVHRLLQRAEDAPGNIILPDIRFERNLVAVPQLEAELGKFLTAEDDG